MKIIRIMKYLKYSLGLIAILIIGFFFMGIIKPKLVYDCEIIVEKPAPESWAVIQDEEKMSEWLPGFQKIEHLSGTPGTIGGVSLVYLNNDGQQMSIRETITDIVPEKSISMTFQDDFMNMDYIIYLISIDGKTKIKSSTTAVGNSTISKSIMALMGGSIKAQEEANLVNLKKAIEQNTKDYFHAGEEIIKNEE